VRERRLGRCSQETGSTPLAASVRSAEILATFPGVGIHWPIEVQGSSLGKEMAWATLGDSYFTRLVRLNFNAYLSSLTSRRADEDLLSYCRHFATLSKVGSARRGETQLVPFGPMIFHIYGLAKQEMPRVPRGTRAERTPASQMFTKTLRHLTFRAPFYISPVYFNNALPEPRNGRGTIEERLRRDAIMKGAALDKGEAAQRRVIQYVRKRSPAYDDPGK
jgi:hypothetical protein